MNYAEFSMIRFGGGLSPRQSGPDSPEALMRSLRRDKGLKSYAPLRTGAVNDMIAEFNLARAAEREGVPGSEEAFDKARRALLDAIYIASRARLARAMDDRTGFAERLVQFWSNHFSIRPDGPRQRALKCAFENDAIRANLRGRFADLLKAATLHPSMLLYLDQYVSVGPGSVSATRRKGNRGRGLNENHARELLELHSLGIEGSYAQKDVRQLAELMTGLTVSENRRFEFNTRRVEPGAEEVLGASYGGERPPKLDDIEAFLEDLATHPDTATYISRKLATHFCADDPPQALVADMRDRFRATGGDLMEVYAVMVAHPLARETFGLKLRQPYDLIQAGLRALGVTGKEIMAWRGPSTRQGLFNPVERMGQTAEGAPQPEGWPERLDAWLSPQLLAARIDWAMNWPGLIRDSLPDPRDFVNAALPAEQAAEIGPMAARAETLSDGIGVILASPQFNRR
ncbi:DUF1800 domain-containing protein [Paracoccus sediminicola]|uniref:DUF1800 domain-containing protein n=1 Tax=Paracoccus sediminicola TaxID=3017783 RepID=UPI0022F09A01|nr:DUF1800 domain-containing protein [Paracoccus sediminicola]WBU56967.1 DUF1800 domain-containing protein [Paracoccus sediminicola]